MPRKEGLVRSFKFLQRFIRSPATVGSLIPSSERLGRAIVKDVPGPEQGGPPRRYLEVGAGTGIFTSYLIKKLRSMDQLDVVEYDPEFVGILRSRFGHLRNVHVFHEDFARFRKKQKYDYCISGLPLAGFSSETVCQIYDSFHSSIKKGGKLVYFEYMGLSGIKRAFLPARAVDDFERVLQIKASQFKSHRGSAERILLNLLPARICRLTL